MHLWNDPPACKYSLINCAGWCGQIMWGSCFTSPNMNCWYGESLNIFNHCKGSLIYLNLCVMPSINSKTKSDWLWISVPFLGPGSFPSQCGTPTQDYTSSVGESLINMIPDDEGWLCCFWSSCSSSSSTYVTYVLLIITVTVFFMCPSQFLFHLHVSLVIYYFFFKWVPLELIQSTK